MGHPTFTGEGPTAVFIAVNHCSAECVGIHAHARATRFEALEPIRPGVRRYFGGFAANVAHGLAVRHDHGSQYMSDHFQREIAFNYAYGAIQEPDIQRSWAPTVLRPKLPLGGLAQYEGPLQAARGT